jgi:hypothetical protein
LSASKRPVAINPGPGGWDRCHPVWSLSKIDLDGPFGWRGITERDKAFEVLLKLRDFESQTWAVNLGGRNHAIAVHILCKEARDRLLQLRLDDFDQVMSIRLTGPERVFALRADDVAFLLWWDPEHDVCPSKLR